MTREESLPLLNAQRAGAIVAAGSDDAAEGRSRGALKRMREEWVHASRTDRLAAFDGIYIKHRPVKSILSYIERELELRTAQGHAIGMLVVAEPGFGKSSLIDFLKREYEDEETETQSIRRVVSFSVPGSATRSMLGSALLKALGDPLPNSGNWLDKLNRAEILLCKAKTVIVAIDNFQDIPAQRRERGLQQVSDWVRDLCDFKFPGVVMALGTEKAVVVRDAYDQLRRRMPARFNLPAFSMDTPETEKTFRTLLKVLDGQLPLAESSELSRQSTARALLAASNGTIDYLMKVLQHALTRALDRSSERIEWCDLEIGFDDTFKESAAVNPFKPGWNGEPLTGINEAFAPFDVQHVEGAKK